MGAEGQKAPCKREWLVVDTANPPQPPVACWTEEAALRLAARFSTPWWVGRWKVQHADD